MPESPSTRIERLLQAVEELVQKDEFLVSKGAWEDALENQEKLNVLVSELPELLAQLPSFAQLAPQIQDRALRLIKLQEASASRASENQTQISSELARTSQAQRRLNTLKPAYGNPWKKSSRSESSHRLDSKG